MLAAWTCVTPAGVQPFVAGSQISAESRFPTPPLTKTLASHSRVAV